VSQWEILNRALGRNGQMTALVAGSVRWNYAELAARASRRAQWLSAQGLVAGQVVWVSEVPVLDLLVMQHALVLLGCGLLPLSPQVGMDRDPSVARSAGVEWRWQPGADEGGDLIPTGFGAASQPGPGDARPALVIQTSGSGGAPKAVMLTAANVQASAVLANQQLGLGAEDCWLSCLPRSHVGGLMIGYRCALAGAKLLLHERYDATNLANDLERQRVTHLSLVPPMLARLLAMRERPPPWLRVLLVGGQALSGALARQAIAAGWPLYLSYGMTETASLVAASPRLRAVPEPGLVGPPLPGIQLRCAGTPTSPGRIAIRGPVVMAGYAEAGRRPGAGLEEGWFLTNDLGYLTARGEVAVLGRADEVLVIGGEAVLPARVEDQMMSAPGLEAVVVVALGDPVWGYRLVAAYVGAMAPDALAGWCREHLTDRDRPRDYRRFTRFPTTPSGKPERSRIKSLILAETS
jgi:O-succinylbenzoic acid--CoA ligase